MVTLVVGCTRNETIEKIRHAGPSPKVAASGSVTGGAAKIQQVYTGYRALASTTRKIKDCTARTKPEGPEDALTLKDI